MDRRNRSKKRSLCWLRWAAFWVLMALTVYAAEPEEPKTPITLVSVSPMGGSVVNTTPVFTLTFDKNVANVLVREHNLSQFTLTGPSGESILIHVGIADDEIYPTLKRTVEISVLQALSPGQYKLTVRKGVQAKNGTETAKDYVYFYRVRDPEPETEEEEETEPETEAPETTEPETEETEAPETKATEPESEAKETEATEPETKIPETKAPEPETEGKNPEVQGSQPNSPVKEETKPGEIKPQEAAQETKPQTQEEFKETKPQETEAPTLAAAEQEKPSEEEKEPGGKIFLYEITPGEASDGGFLPQAVKAELTEGTVTGEQTGERDVLSMAAAILCIGLVLLGALYKWVSFRRNRR